MVARGGYPRGSTAGGGGEGYVYPGAVISLSPSDSVGHVQGRGERLVHGGEEAEGSVEDAAQQEADGARRAPLHVTT